MLHNLAIAILAAGKGKRMNNPDLPKVLTLLNGKPLLEYVLETSIYINPKKIIVIIGHQANKVIEFICNFEKGFDAFPIEYVLQREQLGTGHAILQTEDALREFAGDLLILSGDVPLLSYETLQKFIDLHFKNNIDVSVLSAYAPNPTNYGRIVRDKNGDFLRIIEEKDATDYEKRINEINSGIYIIKKDILFDALKEIRNNNAQNEYYLTDVIEILRNKNYKVEANAFATFNEIQGVNSIDDLKLLHDTINNSKTND
ncbi:MAG TPA: sugar phosphate nucleotidyltransferase [Bacteroidota bacterium]|nr:sugar phosphate nucleotidyltransferase [Candidatus Kapabacteria bacterium]HRS01860.1 sugar phosphate nucleotidyltransferase [Bacteroidota bacterium]HRT67318.1 sugar phosphate nucleotidyltransferase [Bacteroidota bacterium]